MSYQDKEPKIRSNNSGGLSKKSMEALMRQAEEQMGRSRAVLGDVAASGLAGDRVLRTRGYVSGRQGGETVQPQPFPKKLEI